MAMFVSGSSSSTGSLGRLHIGQGPFTNDYLIHARTNNTTTGINDSYIVSETQGGADSEAGFRVINGNGSWILGYMHEGGSAAGDMKIYRATGTGNIIFNAGDLVMEAANQKISGSSTSTGSFGQVLANEIVRDSNNYWKSGWLYVSQGIGYNSVAKLDLGSQTLTINKWVNGNLEGPLRIVPHSSNNFHVTASNITIDNEGGVSGSATSTGSFGHLYVDGKSEFIYGGNNGIFLSKNGAGLDHAWEGADDLIIYSDQQVGITIAGDGDGQSIRFADGNSGNERYRGVIQYSHGTDYMSFGTAGNTTALTLSSTQDATFTGHVYPSADNSKDLGSTTKRWANIYTTDMNLSNRGTGGNKVDGTEGDWTIQEGEEDLYLLNNKTGKKYRFKLEEIK